MSQEKKDQSSPSHEFVAQEEAACDFQNASEPVTVPEGEKETESVLEGEVLVEDEDQDGPPSDQEFSSDQEGNGTDAGKETEEAIEEEKKAEEPSIEEQYQSALQQAESNRNDYLRSVADMQNLRKRTARDIQQARQFAIEGFARDLLPVADNMMRALSVLSESDDPAVKPLCEGVEMVQKELDRAFNKHGVVKIESLNVPFDPNMHQAVVQLEVPGAEPGHVVEEMQVGYWLNDRLLRPAMVAVAKKSE